MSADSYRKVITCGQCKKDFETVFWASGGYIPYCTPCTERSELERLQKEKLAAVRYLSPWEKLCPYLYQHTDPELILAKPWAREVAHWQYEPKGLCLVGKTGVGKSRAVWLLIDRLFQEGKKIHAVDSQTFRTANANAATEGNTESWIRTLSRVDVLLFDDLGQMKVTDSAAEALLSIVSKRTENGKPLIITTQYTGHELSAQFGREHLGEAIRRRIGEFCHVIKAV
jgi:nucleoside-triphosphatase THEP1